MKISSYSMTAGVWFERHLLSLSFSLPLRGFVFR